MTFRRLAPVLAVVIGIAGLLGAALALAAADPEQLPNRAIVPGITRAERTPTPSPTPKPLPYVGPVASIYLSSAHLYGGDPIETGGSHFEGGREYLDDPTAPQYIMQYTLPYLAQAPGFGGGHTIFAAHVNYVHYGNGPFAYLTDTQVGDALYITMANGDSYTYTVKSVEVIPLSELNMDDVVFPPLDSTTERVTLLSCAGDFFTSNGLGEYDGRIIVVAERQVP